MSLAACGASNENASGDAGANITGDINGGGASSQEKAQEAWAVGFQGKNAEAVVNYQSIGSGDGRKRFIEGGTLFAGTDSYLKDDEGELSAAKERCGGTDPIEVPAYISPIAVIYNVDIEGLKLSGDTIAQIFDGKIKTWNDPAIAADNEGVELPSTKITPVHRSDDSGTTKNFTDYLGKATKSWSHEAEDAWPAKGGLGAEGTSGVVSAVKNAKGAIGYADASQTGDLKQVAVKVGESYVDPSAKAAAKVIAVSPRVEGRPDVDMAVDVDRTTTEEGTYPIILASYLVACQQYDSAEDAEKTKAYLSYVLSEEGQDTAAKEAGSAQLDAETRDAALAIVDKIAAK
nr:phosphate ABC transporter substrate-binding protein PstS [Nocardioides daedukensis]